MKDNHDVELDHIDALALGNCGREEKLRLIIRELQVQLYTHGIMIQEWSTHIAWLWDRYEGLNGLNGSDGRDLYHKWTGLLVQVANDQVSHNRGGGSRTMGTTEFTNEPVESPDTAGEEVVLDLYVNDGEGDDDGQTAIRTGNGEVDDETSREGQPEDANGGDEDSDWETYELDI